MMPSSLERDLDHILTALSTDESELLGRLKLRYALHFSRISSLLYEALPPTDQVRFILWFAKRWANIGRVPADELAAYQAAVERVHSHPYTTGTLDGQEYKRLDLAVQGYRGELLTYPWMLGIHDFLFDQYQHGDFRVLPGDTIIDAGAFVGDTALLFHEVTGGECSIHAFEVLDENLRLLRHNLVANGIADRVDVCALALSNRSGDFVNIKAPPVQGATSIFGDSGGVPVETITIDDYVSSRNIERVDLIKMDIEGAERLALAGAVETIRRYRPRLAICIYHLWDDAFEIPQLIRSMDVPYRYAFKWVELRNGWEAVLLCTPETSPAP